MRAAGRGGVRRPAEGPQVAGTTTLSPMARVSREEVERVAALARLSLDASEAQRAAVEMEALLDYVAVLANIDTEGVPPTSHVLSLATPLRDDAVTEALDPELAIANAPEREGTAFVVPRVIDDADAG